MSRSDRKLRKLEKRLKKTERAVAKIRDRLEDFDGVYKAKGRPGFRDSIAGGDYETSEIPDPFTARSGML